MPKIPLLSLLTGTVFALIWSGSFIAVKAVLPLGPPLWLAAMRLLCASLLLTPIVGGQALRIVRTASARERLILVGSAALAQSYYLGAVFYSLHALSAALVSVIASSLPLVSIPIATTLLKERTSVRELLATAVAVLSICTVILGRHGSRGVVGTGFSPDVLLMLSAVLALATGNTLLKPLTANRSLLPLIASQMVIGSGILLIVALAVEGLPNFHGSATTVSAFVYLVTLGSIVGMWLWVTVLRRFSAIGASGFFLLTSIFGVLLGFLIFSERLTDVQLIGTAVLCCTILLRTLSRASMTQSKVEPSV